jgi:hypothetical protein
MGEINTPRAEQEAIAAIDSKELYRLIEWSKQLGNTIELRPYLSNCGSYISTNLYAFEQALTRDRAAKSSRKREETQMDLYRAASDLTYAVDGMQRRVEEERQDRDLFIIDDLILPPRPFSPSLSVRVSYSWRATDDDSWKYGSITFTHDVVSRPDYTIPAPKRKPSKAQQERDIQTRLGQTWEHLKRGALYSVREYFKDGRDGGEIPKIFQARADARTGSLNNFSAQFW